MTRNQIIELMKEIIRENGKPLPEDLALSDSIKISELGLDSLSFIELLFGLEEKLGIEIPMEAVANLETLGEFITHVETTLSRS